MQAQMAHFPAAEAKKHRGFDFYGGVYNSRIFGSVRASEGNLDRLRSRHSSPGSYSPSVYSFSKNEAARQQQHIEETMKSLKSGQDMNRNLKAPDEAENVNSKGSVHEVDDNNVKDSKLEENLEKDSKLEENSEKYSSDFSDNSMRSSSDSYSLGRKSSDASSCSSCGSVSGGAMKGASPGRGVVVRNVKVGGSYSGELNSAGSSNGGSPTAESRGRRSPSGMGNILGNGFAKTANSKPRAPLGNVKHHALVRSKSTSCAGCPPPLKRGYCSSSSGEIGSFSSDNGNVLPIGNILPSGNILSIGNSGPNNGRGISKAPEHVTGHVLGSGNGNYGHGSIINGKIHIAGQNMMVKHALSSTDPENVKNAGNDQYKKGNFAEALFLYERAIALSPGHALFHSNKSAALAGLGRLKEAVQECHEAIKLDPSYVRAHQRLAILYLRLGEIENAKTHLKLAGLLPDRSDMQKVQAVEVHLIKCAEARKRGDWRSVYKESDAALMAGADSAPQLFTSKAEALLKLHRLDEADAVLMSAPKIEVGTSPRFFGIVGSSYLLLVQAQVDMALGRIESAVVSAERAARMDLYNHEVAALLRNARGVAYARKTGNDLFKAGKFSEACKAYGEGLEHDPMNAILLCNRAACRSKLGQWEKAVEDCNAALSIQPNYTKALLRRADSNAKLEQWEKSLRDYEALRREVPGDIQVARALFEVQVAFKKSRGEDINNMKFGGEVEVVSSNDQFREAITAPGLAVVHFTSRSSERCKHISPFVDQLCKRYPSVNFLKVDVQENLFLAKSESVSSVPTFKIYKNGFKVKEIIGPAQQVLENSVKHYSL